MIKEGDIVDVYFEYVGCELEVKVLSVPRATGDCWHLEREDGTLVYVNSFSRMVKKVKGI